MLGNESAFSGKVASASTAEPYSHFCAQFLSECIWTYSRSGASGLIQPETVLGACAVSQTMLSIMQFLPYILLIHSWAYL